MEVKNMRELRKLLQYVYDDTEWKMFYHYNMYIYESKDNNKIHSNILVPYHAEPPSPP